MHVDRLLHMANQIGHFFEAMPDRDEALRGAAQHLKNFWEPRMRRELLDAIDHAEQGTEGLSPFMAEAIARHRTLVWVAPPAGEQALGKF
jgi:formate dehydrogenase subunit delta